MKPAQFTMAYFLQPDWVFRSARSTITRDTPIRLHTSDFAEVFWVESGTGIHLVNGKRRPLTRGTLVTVRPTDYHRVLAARGTAGLTIVNVIFDNHTLESLRRWHFPNATAFFWATTRLPWTIQLNAVQLRWLAEWAVILPSEWHSQLTIERFLLELLTELQILSVRDPTGPSWLQRALKAVREPQHFRGGTPAFARLAGRSPQHVNRVLRQHCGLTATEVVNQARMEYAAKELTKSEKKIIEICQECGFQNLGHFHEVFRRYYQTTPHHYQRRQRVLSS